MKPVSVLLLPVCALAVEAQNLTGRTFGFAHSHHDHNHGAVHDSHALNFQAHGHHHHVPPAHSSHGSHAHQVHGQDHHQSQEQVSPGQQHHSSHGHQHHPHQPSASSGAVGPVAGNVDMVPVMVCNVVHVPAAHAVAPGPSHSGSLVPNSVLSKVPTSIGHVAGKVVSPLVSLLHNASVWLNRTAHSNHAHTVHHQPHPAASPAHVVHEILALKKHPHQPVPPRTVATTMTPRPAAAVTSPTPTAAAATPSIRATTVSVPVQVQTGTVGVPAPALGATAPRFLSTAKPASSANTAAFPEGRTGALVTAVPLATTTTAFSTLPTASPAPTFGTAVHTLSPTVEVSIRSGTIFTTADATTSAATFSVAQSAPTSANAALAASASLPPTEVVSIRSGTFASTVALTRADTLTPVLEPVTAPATVPTSSVTSSTLAVRTSTEETEDLPGSVTSDGVSPTTSSPITSQASAQSPRPSAVPA
ncbi:uncharacterized protein LOC144129879 [Amblyomma americanum]